MALQHTVREGLLDEADRLIEMLETHDSTFVELQVKEMADGSRRWAAFITSFHPLDNEVHTHRITTPALSNSPQWARDRFGEDEFLTEVV